MCVCDASSFIFLSLTNNEYISIQKKTFFFNKMGDKIRLDCTLHSISEVKTQCKKCSVR